MVNDDLVKKIVQEVIKQVNSEGQPRAANLADKKVLALFSGGAIGLRESLAEIKKIMEAGYDVKAVFTPAAERVIGSDLLKSYLGSIPIITEAEGQNPGTLIKGADIVIVPVLTLNSAAKLACGIADNLAVTLVLYGLMAGKPVIAVRDACDLNNKLRTTLRMDRANRFYQKQTADNLNRLEEFGVTLVDSGTLSAAVIDIEQKEGGSPQTAQTAKAVQAEQQENGAENSGKRENKPAGRVYSGNVLSAGDIAVCNESKIRISKKTVVTSMARDMARERGIEIVLT
jgi:hypothetical protein